MLLRTIIVAAGLAIVGVGGQRAGAAIVLVSQTRTVSAGAFGGTSSTQNFSAPTFFQWNGNAGASSVPTGGSVMGNSYSSAAQDSTVTATLIAGAFSSSSAQQGGAFSANARSTLSVVFQVTEQPVQIIVDSSRSGQASASISLTNTVNTWVSQYNATLPVGTYTFLVDIFTWSGGSQFSSTSGDAFASLTFVPSPPSAMLYVAAAAVMARRRLRRCA